MFATIRVMAHPPAPALIVDEADRVKRAEEAAALVEYLKNPADDATLVLESSENPREMDRKIVAAVPKDNQKIFWVEKYFTPQPAMIWGRDPL